MSTHSVHDQEIISNVADEFAHLNDLRQRVLAGEEVPASEYATVIESLRRSRTALAAEKTTKSRAKKEPIIDPSKILKQDDKTQALDDLLGDDE